MREPSLQELPGVGQWPHVGRDWQRRTQMGSRSNGRSKEAKAEGNGMYWENHVAPAGPDVTWGEAGEGRLARR